VIGKGAEIVSEDLPFSKQDLKTDGLPKSLKIMEKIHIERVLEERDWNITRAAHELEIDRQTLYNKIEKYKIERRR